MEDEITNPSLRLAHGLFYVYLILVPALALFGLLHLDGAASDAVFSVFGIHTALNWLIGISLVAGALAYFAVVGELARPPKNTLVTMLLVLDAPLLLVLGLLAGGGLNVSAFAVDGVIEITAVTLAILPIQFTGSVQIDPKTKEDIPLAIGMTLLFCGGALALFIALLSGFIAEGEWTVVVAMIAAVVWSTYSYYRLIRYAETTAGKGKWTIIGVALLLVVGLFLRALMVASA
ncbi:MAG: hypothetical protein ACYTDT_00435 [Planctomycetota bacterium]|jgi:hypothetical protein